MKKVLLLLGLGVVYYLAQFKDFLKGYSIKFLTAKLDIAATQNSGYSKIFFKVRIRIVNESEFKGILKSGIIEMFYKGKKVATGEQTEEITIAPKSEIEINIPAAINTSHIVTSLIDIWQVLSKTRFINFTLKGKLNFAAGTYNINHDYQVEI